MCMLDDIMTKARRNFGAKQRFLQDYLTLGGQSCYAATQSLSSLTKHPEGSWFCRRPLEKWHTFQCMLLVADEFEMR